MFLQSTTLAQALGDTVAQSPVAVQLAEETAEKMNLFEMALKGGWIMLVLLLLSIVCFYIFFNRLAVYRKAAVNDPHFMDRINDYMKNGENKSAQIFCQATASPVSRIVEKGIGLADHDTKDIQLGMENAANVEIAKLEKGLKGAQACCCQGHREGSLLTSFPRTEPPTDHRCIISQCKARPIVSM